MLGTVSPIAAIAAEQPVAAEAAVQSELQSVIERANAAQAQAFNRGTPEVMRSTATDDYYNELVQTNQKMAAGGVASIRLVRIQWADSSVNGDTAQVTTIETWRTTMEDGRAMIDSDRNVYTLVRQDGSWKIQKDDHPDTGVNQPPPDTSVTRAAPTGPSTSNNWSGYAAANGKYTAVTGTWTLPEVKITGSPGTEGTWVGIGGLRSRDLIQAGTSSTTHGGQVTYEAWIETLPAPPHTVLLAVNAGDSVTTSITEQMTGQWLITLKNNTTGKSYSEPIQYQSSYSSAEWIEEAPASPRGLLPLNEFGSVKITNGSAVKDGQTVNIAQAGGQPITMIDRRERPIVQPSALEADGATFSATKVASTVGTAPVQPQQQPGGRRGRGRPQSPFSDPGFSPWPGFAFP
jgi:ketosteroid isomerase-like protein